MCLQYKWNRRILKLSQQWEKPTNLKKEIAVNLNGIRKKNRKVIRTK